MDSAGHQVVVVTGASAGVGRATARAFAARGATLALLARGLEGLEAAAREVESLGGRALLIPTDVSDGEAVEAAAALIEHQLGPIDVWVNVAMTSVFSPALQMQLDEFRRVIAVNYLGYVHGTLAAVRRMTARDRGTVVQVSSALAFRGLPLQSAYCASKAAIIRFTEALRSELLHDGSHVHLTSVHMPALNTPQFDWSRSRMPHKAQPVPPIFQPEVAAKAIVWAAHHRRRTLRVGFSTVKAMLASELVPSFVDRYLARRGYRAQQTSEPADPSRPDNLYQPVPGDFGAHGRFDARARRRSAELWAAMHLRGLLALGAVTALVAGTFAWRRLA